MRPWLSTVAHQLPFHAIAVHSEQLDKIREEEVGSGKGIPNVSQSDSLSKHSLVQARLEQENQNPITFEWLVSYLDV